MLTFKDIQFKYDDQPLFIGLSLSIHAGHRVGIVGRNGVGKSTLFELLLGNLIPDDGDISFPKDWRIATLHQNIEQSPRTALDFVMDGDKTLRMLEQKIDKSETHEDHGKLVSLLSQYEDFGGYHYAQRAQSILSGLGFRHQEFQKPHREFSGGWRIRLNLAQTLMTPSDLLLLDEPTNHLDLEAVTWLFRWLQKYEGTVVVIAHDREFLDRIATEIIHLDQGVARSYKGGYSAFEEQRAALLLQQEILLGRQEKERARIQKFVDRFRAKATKAKQVQSRIKLLEKMTFASVLREESSYRFDFPSQTRFDQPMVSFDECALGYGEHTVIESFTQRIYPKDRIGILGANGAGKTTLLRALAQQILPLRGKLKISENTTVGYFAQHQLELLQASNTAFDHIDQYADFTPQSIRNFLGAWGFSGDDCFRLIHRLSGGEKARLVLATLALQKPALLVLDEPTNHLDIEMRSALASAMDTFGGALVVVAHDQHLLRQCVDELWFIHDGRVTTYSGDLDDYEVMLSSYTETRPHEVSHSPKVLRKYRALQRQQKSVLLKERDQLERSMEEFNKEVQDLTVQLADRSALESLDRTALNDLFARHSHLSQEVARLEVQWYSITEKLDGFNEHSTQ